MNQNAQPPIFPAPYIPRLPSDSPPTNNTPPLPSRDNSMSPPHDRPPRATTPSSSSTLGLTAARDSALSKKLQAMLLETAKQQVHVNTAALDRFHRFEEPTDFLQFSNFTDAVRERIRGKFWSAQFETWISQQLGPKVKTK